MLKIFVRWLATVFSLSDRVTAIRRLLWPAATNRNTLTSRALTARAEIGGETVLLAKPETYMNLSGLSVRELLEKHDAKPESDLIVIQDELDFSLGMLRIHTRRSSAGHNGIESIIDSLGTKDFLRIRIGVAPEHKLEDGQRYLLGPMRKAELAIIDGVLDAAEEAVKVILKEGAAAAMNRFNRKEEKD